MQMCCLLALNCVQILPAYHAKYNPTNAVYQKKNHQNSSVNHESVETPRAVNPYF